MLGYPPIHSVASALSTILVLSLGALAGITSAGEIVRDGSVGSGPLTLTPATGGGPVLITEEHGQLAGENLLHSFSAFDLDAGEWARFEATSTVSNVISRVTGGSPSRIDGRLESAIPNADFFFINP